MDGREQLNASRMCPSIERFLLQVVRFRVRLDPSTEASSRPVVNVIGRYSCGSLTPTCSGTAHGSCDPRLHSPVI